MNRLSLRRKFFAHFVLQLFEKAEARGSTVIFAVTPTTILTTTTT